MKRTQKINQKTKRCNQKNRRNASKRQRQATRRQKRRPARTLLGGRRFYSLEGFLRFLHQSIGDLVDEHFGEKAPQSKYSWRGCMFALMLRCLLGFVWLSQVVEELENNPALSSALGFKQSLKNSKPLTECLLKLSLAVAQSLYQKVLLRMKEHGLVFGKTVGIDTAFLHIYGNRYEKAQRGYSGQLKRTACGYKIWVAHCPDCNLALAFHVDSGNVGDGKHFRLILEQAQNVLGTGQIRYVLADRGFCDRELYYGLKHSMRVCFVFRAKAGETNAYIQDALDALTEHDYRGMNKHCRVASTPVLGLHGDVYLLCSYRDRRFKNPMYLITNDLLLTPTKLLRLYRQRWRVETYFAQEKGSLLLGRFVCTKFDGVCGTIFVSLLTKLLLSAFVLFLGRRYHHFSPLELRDRVFLHGFFCSFEELMRPSWARKELLIAALQRVWAILEQWDELSENSSFRP